MASSWAPVRTTTGTNPSKFTLLPKTSQQGTLACSRNPASVSAGEQVACQEKTLTNMRSSTADAARRLNANMKFSLEEAMEFVSDDELVEVAPQNLR